MLSKKEFVDTVSAMKTILWEPMTDGIYATYDSLTDAVNGQYYIDPLYDYVEIKNGEIWIALVD